MSQTNNNNLELLLADFVKEDYPQYPFNDLVDKSKADINSVEHKIITSDFVEAYPEYKPYVQIFNDAVNLGAIDQDMVYSRFIPFWKKHARKQFAKIMQQCELAPHDATSISQSVYLTIDSLKEYNTFKFQWGSVTENCSITNRDILANPDLPWDKDALQERSLPRKFCLYKGVPTNKNTSETIEFTQAEILYSPDEPVELTLHATREVLQEEINEALKIIMEENPEYLSPTIDLSDECLDGLKKAIYEHIQSNGAFILDEFIFPYEEPEYKDPFADFNNFMKIRGNDDIDSIVEECISHNFNNSTIIYRYCALVGVYPKPDFHPRNREEFVEILSKLNSYKYNIECCKFFELDDFDSFPKAFRGRRKDDILSRSGKLSLEYILNHQDVIWSVERLVKCLPLDYVFKNLLFYPDRIKLSFIAENKIDKSLSVDEIGKYMKELDSRLLYEFMSREPFEYIYQYSFLDWNFTKFTCNKCTNHNLPKQFKKYMREEKSKEPEHLQFLYGIQDSITWDFLLSDKGFTEILKLYNNDLDINSITDREAELVKILRKNRDLNELVAQAVPDRIKKSNKNTRWFASTRMNINDFIDDYISEFGSDKDLSLCYIFIRTFFGISNYSTGICFFNLFKDYIEFKLSQADCDRSKLYEWLCHTTSYICVYFNEIGIHLRSFKNLSRYFTFKDIGESKFTYFEKFIDELQNFINKKK